jgi:hypothetical protein
MAVVLDTLELLSYLSFAAPRPSRCGCIRLVRGHRLLQAQKKLTTEMPAIDRGDFRAAKNTATMNPEHELHSCAVNYCNQACLRHLG